LPFLLAVGFLSPLAYYASFRATAANLSLEAFWRHWQALPMWPSGPAWFLWQLLLLSTLAAALHFLFPSVGRRLGFAGDALQHRPLAFFVGLTGLSLLAYVPLAMMFGPWDWTSAGPFSVQLSRPLHYVVYFFAGFALGCADPNKSLSSEGALARQWLFWVAAAIASFALWGGLTSLTMPDWGNSPLLNQFGAALAYPIACAAGTFGFLAIGLRLLTMRSRILDALSGNAYSIYLIHYVPVVWLQYALLGRDLPAPAKAAIVFACALAMSWAASAAVPALLRRGFEIAARRAATHHSR
jgi:peptidoglycan/LPS O-acetylase OafA/YrhL